MAGEERSTFVGSGEPATFAGSAARRLPRILVKIAAYRDPELPKTIRSALTNADRPERLRFVIVNQHDLETDEISLAEWAGDHRFRVVDVHFTQTLGLGWARYTCDTMWRGEEFTLQIDSHMRFDPGWDSTLLDDWAARDDPRAVLTAYPREYDYDAAGVETHGPDLGPVALFVASVNDEGESTLQAQPFTSPGQRLLLVAGGVQFAPGIGSREVPNDRRVQYGDELIQSLQFFVAGYNVHSPHSTPLAHFYGRAAKSGARLPVDDDVDVDERQTNARAQFRQRSIAACRSIMFGEAEPRVARRTRQTFFNNLTGYMRTPWPRAWPDRSRSNQLITTSANTHTQENAP